MISFSPGPENVCISQNCMTKITKNARRKKNELWRVILTAAKKGRYTCKLIFGKIDLLKRKA